MYMQKISNILILYYQQANLLHGVQNRSPRMAIIKLQQRVATFVHKNQKIFKIP